MGYLFFVSLVWAFSFSLIKSNLTAIDPIVVACGRLLLSALVFLPLLRLRSVGRSLAVRLVVTGMVQYGMMYMAYIYAFRFLQAYEVALFTILTPLYVTLIDDALRRRFSLLNLCTALLAVVGTGVVTYEGLPGKGILLGFSIVQLSNLCFAFGQVYYRRILKGYPGMKDHHIFGLLYLGAFAITALSAAAFSDWSSLKLTSGQLLTLLYLGVVASGACFFIWNFGARRVGSGTLAIFNNLKIPLAVAVSLVLFREQANLANLLSGGLIILSAFAINHFAERGAEQPNPASG